MYSLELLREDGTLLGYAAVSPDWQPAREWAVFEAFRRGAIPDLRADSEACIEPVWDGIAGRPYVQAFAVRASEPRGGAGFASEVPITYLAGNASWAAESLVAKGMLGRGETFYYRVLGYPGPNQAGAGETPRPRFEIDDLAPALVLKNAGLADRLGRCTPIGLLDAADAPVLIRQEVLADTGALMRNAGAAEIGGVLLGVRPSIPPGTDKNKVKFVESDRHGSGGWMSK